MVKSVTKIDIYTKTYCPFCVRAKALLQQKGVEFKEIKIVKVKYLR